MSELAAIDELFKRWNKDDSPGAAVAVIQNGDVIYKRGFGCSNLEHSIPITSSTVFYIGSESKQFTAFAIFLLERENRVSLNADIGDYLPELNLAGKGITVQHLMHHTSGIRDYVDLHILAGRRVEDYFTHADNLRLIQRQKTLNFDPGEKFLYSNSGYTLLSEIITRQSGLAFGEFCEQRLFKPLGMLNTSVERRNGVTTSGLAASYSPDSDDQAFRRLNCSLEASGAGGILSTVDDLIRWVANFSQPVIGDAALLRLMLRPGLLNNGKKLTYAGGLGVNSNDNRAWVEHGGSIAGFRSNLLRIAEQQLSVIVLANSENVPAEKLTHEIADLILGTQARSDAVTTEIKKSGNRINLNDIDTEPLTGNYQMRPGFFVQFFLDKDRFYVQATGQRKFQLYPSSENTFFVKEFEASVCFDGAVKGGKMDSATWFQNNDSHSLRRAPEVEDSSKEQLAPLAGLYFSDELNTMIKVELKNISLIAYSQRDELELHPIGPDEFSIPPFVQLIKFAKNASGRYDACRVSSSRAKNLEFVRLD